MDYHELIDALTSILPEKVLYGDLIGAEGIFAHSGPLVYEDPEPYFVEEAIKMLEHLYSELKSANARCETLSKMVTQYQDELIPGYRELVEKAERERDNFQAILAAYKNVCSEVLTGRIQELVEADREGAVHIGSCGFCEYYQMDKFCCCPDWVEDDYAIVRKPKDYCTKFKKASWVDEIWGENGCPSCPGYRPTALKERKQDG